MPMALANSGLRFGERMACNSTGRIIGIATKSLNIAENNALSLSFINCSK